MKPQVVYEDNNLLVVNKPSGLITHPKNTEDKQDSLTGWLIEKYPQIKTVGEDPLRPGLVHRLDKDTSGLLVIAKNQDSFFYLKSLFQDKKIKKYYLALVHGKPKESKGIIDAPMGRIGMKRTTQLHGKKKLKDEKTAVTEYKLIKYYPLSANDYSLLEVSPHTGRTHQIRVHLKSIGTPIAGDPLYGHGGKKSHKEPNRLFLHAYKLQFVSPDGKALTIEAELPDELQKVLNMLK